MDIGNRKTCKDCFYFVDQGKNEPNICCIEPEEYCIRPGRPRCIRYFKASSNVTDYYNPAEEEK